MTWTSSGKDHSPRRHSWELVECGREWEPEEEQCCSIDFQDYVVDFNDGNANQNNEEVVYISDDQ